MIIEKNGSLKILFAIDMSFWHVSYFFYLLMSKRNGAHALKQKLLTRMSLTIIRLYKQQQSLKDGW